MMQNSNAYQVNQAYRSAAVAVPPLKAMVMLHEGAMSFLQRSLASAEAKRFEESHGYMIRATAILRGLSHNLDFARGGAVAERLYTTYQSLIMACLRAYGRPHAPASFQRIIASIAELRDAWKFVAAGTAPAGAA